MPSSIRVSASAAADIEQVVDRYADLADPRIVDRFVEAIADTFDLLARQPSVGSPRNAVDAGVSGLRTWPLARFPYVVCYLSEASAVDVLRVLHTARDLWAVLAEGDAVG